MCESIESTEIYLKTEENNQGIGYSPFNATIINSPKKYIFNVKKKGNNSKIRKYENGFKFEKEHTSQMNKFI